MTPTEIRELVAEMIDREKENDRIAEKAKI
jgi:hypothetical protein